MSISIDFTSLLSTTGDLVNGIFPVFVPIIGFGLAFAVIGFLYSKLTNAVKM